MRYFNFIIILMFMSISIFADVEQIDLWKGQRKPLPAKALATGGAQNIGATKSEAASMNPATLITKDKKYMMSFDSIYSSSDIPTQFMLSAVDSRTSMIAGGVYVNYYNYSREEGADKVNYDGLKIGLSYAYPVINGLVVGIAGKYLEYNKDDDNYIRAGTFDLGLTYRISPYIKLGVVGYNLTKLDYIETPMQIVTGFSVGDDEFFLLNFDFVADFSAPEIYGKSGSALYEYHTGIQVTPIDGFSILAGYEINKVLDENFWSTGMEWFIPESRVEFIFAYLQSTSKNDNKHFSFSLRIYF